MLILLQPGIQPLGQFDIKDSQIDLVSGGEVAAIEALSYVTDGYAADVWSPGPRVHLVLGSAGKPDEGGRVIWGLVDEGTSAGLAGRSYGSMFGQLIGGTVGQGTGIGASSTSGAVVLGPSTMRGSGKATLWTKPGLYGVTQDAWAEPNYDISAVNDSIHGQDGTGKLGSGTINDGRWVGYFVGPSADASFVSTPPYYAGAGSNTSDYAVIYLVGCS